MCDDNILKEMGEHLSRRRLGALAVGAGFAAALPRPSNAMDVVDSKVEIKTPDGMCEAHFVHPSSGKHPAVLVWPDAFGLRPAFEQMGKRLAESGYAVLSINPYYRSSRLPALPEGLNFSNPDDRAQIMKMIQTLTPETNVIDANAFVAWIDSQDAVDTSAQSVTPAEKLLNFIFTPSLIWHPPRGINAVCAGVFEPAKPSRPDLDSNAKT